MKNCLLILLFLFFCAVTFAQDNGTIQGRITDAEMNDEPMLYAEVSLKDSAWSTRTNFHGNFEMTNVEAGNYTLVVSYLGYETLELPIEVRENNVVRIYKAMQAMTPGYSEEVLSFNGTAQ
jgi:hypothetical protein